MDASMTVRSAPAWPATVAWGSGLIQLSLGAGALTGAQGGVPLLIAGTALAGLGAAGIAWGGAVLARGRIVVPRAGTVGALTGVGAMGVALAVDPVGVSVIAVAAASALLVLVGIACARETRRRRSDAATPRRGTLRMWGLVASAALVAAVVTPALSATDAGRLAPDHSAHDLVFDGGHQH